MRRRRGVLACALVAGTFALGAAGGASAQGADDEITRVQGTEETLPFTGGEPGLIAGAGLLMAGVGVALRRRLRQA